eukprot:CAMPEP_0171102898 /NCGR_PEP_ID=MMETSP0766_2-20121228/58622_1 /TAXON_ID=439317 /ORGANISM="Gambierdiscus australes, Strain CAWD 149" /LENGTH=143 /DNA_ID=CAMNT_0011563275 /DNA_START=109 /DNA_END=537 /DNA_ORIENTATION=-
MKSSVAIQVAARILVLHILTLLHNCLVNAAHALRALEYALGAFAHGLAGIVLRGGVDRKVDNALVVSLPALAGLAPEDVAAKQATASGLVSASIVERCAARAPGRAAGGEPKQRIAGACHADEGWHKLPRRACVGQRTEPQTL